MNDIIERLTELSDLMMDGRPYNDSDFTDIDEAIDEIKRLRAERDEARRMVCEWHGGLRVQHPQQYAEKRGWDCYKENTNG